MFIEFELQGSKCLHKGIFDTNGFWVKFEPEQELIECSNGLLIPDPVIEGYKIFSHFSFAFYHKDERIAKEVFKGLVNALSGIDWQYPEIGFIREVC